MTEKTESILNAMTIIGAVLVGFILVVGVALGIMLAAGVFNQHFEPLTGLKFNQTEAQVILENKGVIYLTVTANTAEVIDGVVVDDDTVDSDIRLTVRNSRNVIDNTIIDVPSVVKKGVPFAVTAKLASDGSNKGGVCYISAETSDMMYRVASPIEIKVDVPVNKVSLSATDAYTGQSLDLEKTKFIYQDRAQLSVTVEPARSLYVFGDTQQTKRITYTSSIPLAAAVGLETGALSIDYNPVYTSEEPITQPLEQAVITAKVQKYSVSDPANEDVVSVTGVLGLYPLQLGQILIQNETFGDETSQFETKLFGAETLKISAQETGMSDVINLNVYLQPTIVKETTEEYNPMSDLSQFIVSPVFEGGDDDAPKALEVVTYTTYYLGKQVTYWEIKPTRLLEVGEKVYLAMNMLDRSDKYTIKREVLVNEVLVDSTTFEYTNTDDVIIPSISLEINKASDDEDGVFGGTQINYSFGVDNSPSFTKVVNFVTKADNATSDENINTNEVCSPIIVADEKTYQLTTAVDDGYFVLQPKGAGKVNICSYLVRTNEDGEPVDAFYNIITTDAAQAEQKGYALASGFCKASDIASAEKGMYIVQQEFQQFAVTVQEKLTSLKVYTSPEFKPETEVSELSMGTNAANALTLYVKPNSSLAIPEDNLAYSSGLYASVTLRETALLSGDKIFDDLRENITGYAGSYKHDGTKFSAEDPYVRYFAFTLSTMRASQDTSTPVRTMTLSWSKPNETTSYTKSLRITTIDVPVDFITIYDAEDETGKYNCYDYGVSYGEYYEWALYPELYSGASVKCAVGSGDDAEIRTYYRLGYSAVTGSNVLRVPECKCVASEEYTSGGIIKAPSNTTTQKVLFLFDDAKLTADPIRVGTAEYTSIAAVMRALYSQETSATQKQMLWIEIGKRMDSSISVEKKNLANDYASIVDSKLYIRQKLPSGCSMYLMYYSGSGDSYAALFSEVEPIAIELNYSWPEFESGVEGYQIAEGGKYQDSELGTVYYLYSGNNNTPVSFTQDSFNTSTLSYYDYGGTQSAIKVSVSRKITLSTNLALNMTSVSNDTDGTTTELFAISRNTMLAEGAIETVTIKRSFCFAVMSDENWLSITQQADATGLVTDASALEILNNNKVEYALADETVTFKVISAISGA